MKLIVISEGTWIEYTTGELFDAALFLFLVALWLFYL